MVRDRVRDLRRVRAGDLLPNPRNWRLHPEGQRRAVGAILDEVGFADALLVRETPEGGLMLIDGHLRAELDPEQEVPVLVLDLDEREAEKLLAVLDPLAGLAEVDIDAIRALVADLDFEHEDLDAIVAELVGAPPAVDVVEDEPPEPPDEPVTRPGDLWMLGEHRLLCGDSGSAEDVDRLLEGAPIHLVNTDPPYNVAVEPRSNNAIALGHYGGFAPLSKARREKMHHQSFDLARHPEKATPTTKKMRAKDRPLANDFVSEEEFDRLLLAWFGNMARVLLPGRGFYIWGGYANCANYPPVLKACGLYFSQALIWHKMHPVLGRKDFLGDHEWCFYGWREGAAHVFLGPNNVPDVWPIKKVNPQSMIHLTQKPVELAARAIQYSSREGEHVLDLFGGSGSTLMAAEQTGRRAFLMEIDPAYCDVIIQRWEAATGGSGGGAVREDGMAYKDLRPREEVA